MNAAEFNIFIEFHCQSGTLYFSFTQKNWFILMFTKAKLGKGLGDVLRRHRQYQREKWNIVQ